MITLNSKGDEVRDIQSKLTKRGFSTKGIDGYFGKNTEKAVIGFQKASNLEVDGIVGDHTKAALNASSGVRTKEMAAYQIALGEVGTHEINGDRDNPRIVEYFAKTGNAWVRDDETAWCAAFVGFCLETAGIASTRKLNARSYLTWGQGTKTPQLGDVVVLWRGTRTSPDGHVAFFVKKDDNYVYLLGGNQADQVNISKFPLTQVLDYRTLNN